MRKLPTFLLLIPLLLLTGLYFYLSFVNGGVCLKTPVCTEDIQTLCSPKGGKIWQGPSSCSCGFDAIILKRRGWTKCEIPEGYQGKVQTRETSIDLSLILALKTLSLFIVPFLALSLGIGAIVVLWMRKE